MIIMNAGNDNGILLEMTDVCKSFPGVKALDHARLVVRRGSVHALMGENGAGKSTLMKCLFGIYEKDEGSIKIDGEEVRFTGPKNAMENGVAMVHQELNQVLKRNVMDNIWLGRYPTKFGIISERKMYNDTQKLFKELEINVDPKVIMSNLSVAQRQMVEIAKAVSYNARILVLDEPTSSLTSVEVAHLFKIIRRLRNEGCGIIYISHKMDEILEISDEVTVMRDGKYVSTDAAKDLTMDAIIKKMVGRELTRGKTFYRYSGRTQRQGKRVHREPSFVPQVGTAVRQKNDEGRRFGNQIDARQNALAKNGNQESVGRKPAKSHSRQMASH